MHFEILVEDSSGAKLLEALLPQVLGDEGRPHRWRVHHYKGIGRIPRNMAGVADPTKRILLDRLPSILQGYAKTPGFDAIVVVVDTDNRDCVQFLQELNAIVKTCDPKPRVLFRLAMEEIEAWYLGDKNAIKTVYPRVKNHVLDRYVQDSVCGTWELLADAIYPGGSAALRKLGCPPQASKA